MRRCNLPLLILSIMWWYLETDYFGWNVKPGSFAELCCDGLALAGFFGAFMYHSSSINIIYKRRSTDR